MKSQNQVCDNLCKNLQRKRNSLCVQLFVKIWPLLLDMYCLLDTHFKIIVSRIHYGEILTWIVCFTRLTNLQMISNSRRWSAMFLYPRGQVADCFANVGIVSITRTCKFVNHIGQQGQRSTALQWEIVSHFEGGEHNSEVNKVIGFE